MGTSTKIELESAHLSLTPEECSAEILKVLYGYLPEEIRNDPETATVITVPAAFNQMKKDATLQAAKLAGIGRVALMQEPVAAIMSVMRSTKKEGMLDLFAMLDNDINKRIINGFFPEEQLKVEDNQAHFNIELLSDMSCDSFDPIETELFQGSFFTILQQAREEENAFFH